ncbi:MAG: prenyltransferase [Candidatus Nanosalina sp.]
MWNEIKYIFKLSRPRFWLYLAGPALVGMVYGVSQPSQFLALENLLVFLYFLIPANIMLYGINDFFDRDVDEENPKKDGKEESYRSSKVVDGVIGLSSALAIPVTLMMPERVYPLMLVFLGLSYQYSAPPLRFKTKPYLDSLSNGLYAMPFFITYTWLTGSLPPLTVMAGAWLWTMAMHTFSAIPDIEPDREAGIQTTATYLGRVGAYGYVTAVWIFSGFFMALHDLRLGLLFAVYPVLTAAIFFLDFKDSRAYWWFPFINAFIGMVITVYGLWVLFHA